MHYNLGEYYHFFKLKKNSSLQVHEMAKFELVKLKYNSTSIDGKVVSYNSLMSLHCYSTGQLHLRSMPRDVL